MRKTTTKKAAARSASRKAVAAKTTSKAAKDEGPRSGSKLEKIEKLLKRPSGCTTQDVLEATGWPSVSMPQQAKALGITLKREKDGNLTRYRAAA